MRKALSLAFLLVAGFFTCGCLQGRKSAAGFHVPDGDVAKGEAVFVAMRCHSCHRVAGAELPPPVADPPVPVLLGGRVPRARTDGELAAAIIDPSHRLATGYRPETIQAGGLSRMGEFADAMTVRELVDLVAFLQSRYEVVPPAPPMK
jgi:mono/diheme cytochrome c family protein